MGSIIKSRKGQEAQNKPRKGRRPRILPHTVQNWLRSQNEAERNSEHIEVNKLSRAGRLNPAERQEVMKLFIEGRRNGHSPAQCGRTMTVGDLIAYLEQFDEDTEVYLNNDNGYTYGSIDEMSFEEQDDDEEGDEDE